MNRLDRLVLSFEELESRFLLPVAIALAVLLILLLATDAVHAQTCGKERWPVKVMNDKDAGEVRQEAIDSTVENLVQIAAPSRTELVHAQDARFPAELKEYEVAALIEGYKHETDGDYHVVIGDPYNPAVTMIAEIPDPGCEPVKERKADAAVRTAFEGIVPSKPTAKYKTLDKPILVNVTGVYFFDYVHGQTGHAPNGAELHPVLSIIKP